MLSKIKDYYELEPLLMLKLRLIDLNKIDLHNLYSIRSFISYNFYNTVGNLTNKSMTNEYINGYICNYKLTNQLPDTQTLINKYNIKQPSLSFPRLRLKQSPLIKKYKNSNTNNNNNANNINNGNNDSNRSISTAIERFAVYYASLEKPRKVQGSTRVATVQTTQTTQITQTMEETQERRKRNDKPLDTLLRELDDKTPSTLNSLPDLDCFKMPRFDSPDPDTYDTMMSNVTNNNNNNNNNNNTSYASRANLNNNNGNNNSNDNSSNTSNVNNTSNNGSNNNGNNNVSYYEYNAKNQIVINLDNFFDKKLQMRIVDINDKNKEAINQELLKEYRKHTTKRKCNICEKLLSNKDRAVEHVGNQHTDCVRRPFMCQICVESKGDEHKGFCFLGGYNRHLKDKKIHKTKKTKKTKKTTK